MSDDHVFGIDLGTTYSAIGLINEYGQAEIIKNGDGEETTPSVVFFESGTNFVVGKQAKNEVLINRETTVSLIKRQMGTDFRLDFHNKEFSPESISALILKELVGYARENTGIDTDKVVITVPAYFGLAEREATRQAGEIAGLDVVGILTEPVAAALSVGITGQEEKTLFVYDLGGGTFDCTIMHVAPTAIDVLAIDGNRQLGGADWDQRLFDLVNSKFIVEAGLGDEDPCEDEDFAQRLMTEVEDLKKALSRKERASVVLAYGDVKKKIEVARDEFEAATRPLVDETVDIVKRALATAQQKRPGLELDEVLLVGGSSKMPMIEKSLVDEMGWNLRKTDQDLAVAKGAAVYANGVRLPDLNGGAGGTNGSVGTSGRPDVGGRALDGSTTILVADREVSVRNLLSRGLGVRFVRKDSSHPDGWRPYVGFEAHQQDQLPLIANFDGYAAQDDTTELTIRIYEQRSGAESEDLDSNKELVPDTPATLRNLPNLPEGSVIHFDLTIDSEGIGRIGVIEPVTAQRIELPIKLAVLQDEDVQAYKAVVDGMVRSS